MERLKLLLAAQYVLRLRVAHYPALTRWSRHLSDAEVLVGMLRLLEDVLRQGAQHLIDAHLQSIVNGVREKLSNSKC